MAYQDKIDAALALVREHNDVVGDGNTPGHVDENKFVQGLKAFGATSEDDLSSLSWEKITDLLVPATTGVQIKPEGLARKIAKSWRGEGIEPKEDAATPVYVSDKKAGRMTPRELLEAFDPEEPGSAVGKRLKSLSKGQPFLVYQQGRIVDVDASHTLLMEVKQGYPPRATFASKRVFKIGDLPEAYAEENPLYPRRPLRPDGSCDQLNRSWAGIPTEVRQFVRVMIECGDYKMTQREDGHYLLDLITIESDPLKVLRERYQEAAVQFDDRQKRNDLPNLLVTLTPSPSPASVDPVAGGTASPFEQGKRVQWFAPPTPVSNYYGNTADRGTLNAQWAKEWGDLAESQKRFGQDQQGGGKIHPLRQHMARRGKRPKG